MKALPADATSSVEAEPDGQSKWSKLLWGDKSKKAKSGEGKDRSRGDPALPGLWQVRAMRAGLFGLLLVGALGGTKALLTSGGSSEESSSALVAPAETDHPVDFGVGGFAELYVAEWLSAGRRSENTLYAFHPDEVSLGNAEAGRYQAVSTTTLEVADEGDDYWSVTVAADVVLRTEDDEGLPVDEPMGLRYYTVGVVKGRTGFVATSLPAQVPAPVTLTLPERVIEDLVSPSGELEPVGEALEGFFAALLAGSGAIERYMVSENPVKAITPAPFAETEISSLEARPDVNDETVLLVRAQVVGADIEGSETTMHYTLTVQQRLERWEVVELLPATPLAGLEIADDGDGGGDDGDGATSTSTPGGARTNERNEE